MKIAVIHGEVAEGAGRDEQDVLTQVDFISRGLSDLGHEPVAVPVFGPRSPSISRKRSPEKAVLSTSFPPFLTH
jgi:hypothetical protein